jgi:mono/diheme cytochrome c family protein
MIARGLTALAGALLLAACAPEVEMPTRDDGAAVFAENCAICHGTGGRGDGAVAAKMRPRPADLTRIATRSGGAFDRAGTLSRIDGYQRPAVPGVEMPEFGDLLAGDAVPVDVGDGVMTPTPRPLAALLVYLESIQR